MIHSTIILPGTFQSDTGGTFQTDMTGTFVPDTVVHLKVIQAEQFKLLQTVHLIRCCHVVNHLSFTIGAELFYNCDQIGTI